MLLIITVVSSHHTNMLQPPSLQKSARDRVVSLLTSSFALIRNQGTIQSWPFSQNRRRKHWARVTRGYLLSVPHLYQEIAVEIYRQEPGCTGAILHPLLTSLEVNSRNISDVRRNSNAKNLANIRRLEVSGSVKRSGRFLVKNLRGLTHLSLHNQVQHIIG